ADIPPKDQNLTTSHLPENWPLNGSVRFQNLAASYAGAGNPVLHSIDLDIRASEKISLCGRMSSGKSSLVAALFGLLHQQPGRALINDIPTNGVTLAVLRIRIVVMPQE
ncbi:hypothetical protein K432DRAFT_282990, partial [Lepidopterella palustris CBS 459.81]